VRSLLRGWGHDAAAIGAFMGIVSLPWSFKPLYGVLSDFVPLLGQHRRSWLVVCTAATALSLGLVWVLDVRSAAWLLPLLFVPTLGIAFSDVVVDGLMVETGQRYGLTGRLQSVQWAALYGASIGNGWLGGQLASSGRAPLGFLLCAGAALLSLVLTLRYVREPPRIRTDRSLRDVLFTTWTGLRHPGLAAAAAFLVLWSFNPFTTSVQYVYLTDGLGLSEALYGNLLSVQAIAALLAAVGYGIIAPRLSTGVLLHGGIALGVASTLAWWGLADERSAIVVSIAFGATYLLGSLMTMDLAARSCPLALSATLFAVLMASSNLASSAAEAVGGALYAELGARLGPIGAYRALVSLGAASTAACWLVLPALRRAT
jgi:Na+/melibiose symporter-like transporter